ncbi:MAG TPA: glycosyltransferase family 4 protein [Solirubrobacteraceae bacterium]|nr:glycosyltransferase family 4 protein [Solirubrobacteraceae bacterium]
MRILVFHGYLLAGTGSNVYNARLAAAFVRQGHEVHLLCQDRHPEQQGFVGAAGDWDKGALQVRELRGVPPGVSRAEAAAAGHCTVYRPDIGALLPVYVSDRYEGIQARTFAECSDEQVADYVEANVAAVRELVELVSPDVALANHLVMGPAILARALGGRVPYAVKVHGSALEYTVKPEPERFLPYAREGVAGAAGILVGSHHTAASLWQALADPQVERRTRLGPPGVDVERFVPRERPAALAELEALTARLCASPELRESVAAGAGAGAQASGGDAFARDERAAGEALGRLDPSEDRLVAFVGKLIVSKGVDLLLAAWPLVLEQVPRAKLVVVGFGAYRDGFERLRDALKQGDLERAREIAGAGRSLEADPAAAGPPAEAQPLRHLLAFLDGLSGTSLERYEAAARTLDERVVLTGRLEHEELAELLPACEAMVVPSTFPEAFGMVAAEAAACGVLPVSAAHSGLAEVSEALARAVPSAAASLLSFPVDDEAVPAIARRLTGWLTADRALRERTRAGLVETVRERWSWDGVARGVIAAAEGRLDGLPLP